MAAIESLRGGGGGFMFGQPGIHGVEEEEEDSPAVSSEVTLVHFNATTNYPKFHEVFYMNTRNMLRLANLQH